MKDFDIDRIMPDTEDILEAIPNVRRDMQRARVTNVVTTFTNQLAILNSHTNGIKKQKVSKRKQRSICIEQR